jgi:uncharacterized protein (UPF0332 family)
MIEGTLSDEDRLEVVKYRLEKSLRAYHEAVGSIGSGFVETAANRLYYAAYYAVSALLIAYGISARTHNGVIQMFGLNFIKPKLIDRKYGAIFNQLFSLRLTGDYEDRRNLDLQTDVIPLVDPAKDLIDTVSELARKKVNL